MLFPLVAFLAFFSIGYSNVASTNFAKLNKKNLSPFVKKYCLECHGPEDVNGGVDFRDFKWEIRNNENAQDWQDVLDVLNSGEMPPEDEPQPTPSDFTAFVGNLTQSLQIAQKRLSESGGVYKTRRINKREYRNTMKHLFGLNIAEEFIPDDILEEHFFDTAESTQYFDGPLLEQYLKMGTEIAKQGLEWSAKPHSPVDIQRVEPELKVNPKLASSPIHGHPVDEDGIYLCKGGPNRRSVTDVKIRHGEDPRASYKVRVRGGVHDIETPQRHYLMVSDSSPISGHNTGVLDVLKIGGNRENPMISEVMIQRNLFGPSKKPTLVLTEVMFEGITNPGRWFPVYLDLIGSENHRPNVWLDWVELEGPFYDQKETDSVLGQLLSEDGDDLGGRENARKLLKKFTYEAFRHIKAEASYLDKLEAFFEGRMDNGATYSEAMAETLGLVLVSPGFLYIEENGNNKRLDSRGFANRLAHFLWSAPPDKTLYQKASTLHRPEVLRKEVHRMLQDPKADSFFEGFMSQWAVLDRLEQITPDWRTFTAFNQGVRHSMYREPIEFFKVLVQENLGVYYLIDSTFLTVNPQLANYYGLSLDEPIDSNEFTKVPIPADHARGGLMTQGAFLTIGSVGERTSPVIRGALILEKLLNDRPASPPPNVPELTEASEVPLSNRELVELHREQKACASCHDKIDPIGYALESFDAVGRWREEEPVGIYKVPVNTASTLFNGKEIENLRDLQFYIKSQDHQLTLYMIESLLSYGIGRPVEFAETHAIKEQLAAVMKSKPGMEDLIYYVVNSQTFRGKQ